MVTEKLSIGVVGCGAMGKDLAEACATLAGARVGCLCDPDTSLAGPLAEQLGARPYTDYRELLEREKLDGVLVATPQFLHCEVTCAAAAAGAHVFCEKPMAPTLAECDAMIAACERAGVNLMMGLVCRYHTVHRKVRDLVASGELGRPTCMMVRRVGGPWRHGGGQWLRPWRLSMEKTGGLMMEIHSHELDFMRFVCGDVADVFARGATYVQTEADYPDTMVVTLRFANGGLGCLHGGQAAAIGRYEGRVDCTGGSVVFDRMGGKGAGVTYRAFEAEPIFVPIEEIEKGREDRGTPVRQELAEFVESIVENRPPAITGRDGRAAAEIAVAAYQSMRTGQVVALPL